MIGALAIVIIITFIFPPLGVSFETGFQLGNLFLSALAFPAIVLACIVLKDISEIGEEINNEILIVNSMNNLRAMHEQEFFKKYTNEYKIIINKLIETLKNISLGNSNTDEYEKEFKTDILECYSFVIVGHKHFRNPHPR